MGDATSNEGDDGSCESCSEVWVGGDGSCAMLTVLVDAITALILVEVVVTLIACTPRH